MRVVIVRHGQSVANAEGRWQGQLDFELSAEGRRQAELLRGRFTEEKFDPQFVYASPLIRAMGTAEIAMPAKRIITIDDLKEGGAGVFEGRTMDEIRKEYPEVALEFERTRSFNSVPNAESRFDFRKRAQTVVDFFVRGHNKDDEIVAFTHSGLMMFIIAVIMGTNRVWTLRIPNTSVFDFRIDPNTWNIANSLSGSQGVSAQNTGGFEVRRFADSSHLN